jgi:hypothetical protein
VWPFFRSEETKTPKYKMIFLLRQPRKDVKKCNYKVLLLNLLPEPWETPKENDFEDLFSQKQHAPTQ